MRWKQVTSSPSTELSLPLQFIAFANAYLYSATTLCQALVNSSKETTYERGSAIMYLAFHAAELFLKAAILNKSPNERFGHDVEILHNRYKSLYRAKKYSLTIPFQIDYSGLSEPQKISARKNKPPENELYRYPCDNSHTEWKGVYGFEPISFLMVIEKLQDNFMHLQGTIFGEDQTSNLNG
ncbi:MAG: hypothetical protein WCL71_16555 [Deltaproteobacteria bacterium]